MRWNKQTVKTIAIVFATIAFTAFMLKFTSDHDGETITIGGGDPTSNVSLAPDADDIRSGDLDEESGLPWILEDDLPVFAQGTLALIDQGGPYPYERDGIVFENREGLLPDESRGYYHEYTVVRPDAEDRGPVRIIAGSSGEYYYTEDHYGSFERILRRDL